MKKIVDVLEAVEIDEDMGGSSGSIKEEEEMRCLLEALVVN